MLPPQTEQQREKLWAMFLTWMESEGIDTRLVTETQGLVDIDSDNVVLARFGRALYSAGRPYSHYAETINSLVSRTPKVRRLWQLVWDVAFAWRKAGPGRHHTAMPWQVLVAACTTAIIWGWPRVAGAVALAWGEDCCG